MKLWHCIGLQITLGKIIILALWQGDSKAVWRKGNYCFVKWIDFGGGLMITSAEQHGLQTVRAEEQTSLVRMQKPALCGNLAQLRWMFEGFVISLCEISLAERDSNFLYSLNEAKEIFCATPHMKHHIEDVVHKEQRKSGPKTSW